MRRKRSSADDDKGRATSMVAIDAYLADLLAEVDEPSPTEIARAEAVAQRIRANAAHSAPDR